MPQTFDQDNIRTLKRPAVFAGLFSVLKNYSQNMEPC
jgi:hypothetical protein